MRVLVVGQGAREHAIAWKLRQSPLVKELYAAPGNAGIAATGDCVNIGVADIIELADFAEKLRIDLTIVESKADAEEYLRLVFEEKKFGNAANRILIEEFLTGEEVSFMVLTDGKKFVTLAPAKDYKKALDGETGPNTGGMGAHSPAVVLSGETAAEVMKSIIMPTIQGMTAEGRPYTGVLYAGLILTADGPKVLEFNCRFGDPETQVLLPRLAIPLAPLLRASAEGRLAAEPPPTWGRDACVGVVLASEGYPGRPRTGLAIEG